jgi:uncharacterized NAD(P)/FAD-binding protein YdhS
MTMRTDVAVIGSGFSAVALSLNLVEMLPPTAKVSLVGAKERQGKGIAYATTADCHLLNVPAGRMSLFADRPDHFVEWLAGEGYRRTGGDFVPRRIYGRYVGDCLGAALKRTANRAALTLVDTEARSAEAARNGGLVFRLSDGTSLSASVSALCTGAGTGRLPLCADRLSPDVLPFIVQNPWVEAWPERLPPEADVLFVGTGLTMVDQCLLLRRRGFRGTMHAVSRHGLLPQAHLAHRAEPVEAVLAPGGGEVSDMLATLRKRTAAPADWRAVMNGLRPITQDLWKGWSPAQRGRFLRHAAAFWNAHRHRMAPDAAAGIEALRRAGQLVIHRGRLDGLRCVDGRIEAEIRGRCKLSVSADLVVNCTGFERCTVKASSLLASLADRGLVRPDPNGLGIDVDDSSAALAADGESNPRLYALGPLTAGHHWEITAVPDIRVQARNVAERIAGTCRNGAATLF